MSKPSESYLLAGQAPEIERLQLQSRVWEPAARDLVTQLPNGTGQRALDVGCGVMGWLRVLAEWVGPTGQVVGSDIDDKMLSGAKQLVDSQGLINVTLVNDDLFQSRLAASSFDLVHARFQIAPLGRAAEQLAAFRRLIRPGGLLVLEEPDLASWRVNPECRAGQRLIALIEKAFQLAGGNFNAGRELRTLLRAAKIEPRLFARVIALEPDHPYLRLPLQFATSLRPRLESLVPSAELTDLMRQAELELARPETWGTTFTLIQAFGTVAEAEDSS
jgi:SAM-dependent methyltransferase